MAEEVLGDVMLPFFHRTFGLDCPVRVSLNLRYISGSAQNYYTGIYIMSTELRFCDRCMAKTRHEIVEDPETIYTYKRRRLYHCKECGHKSFRRGSRPSAESVY